MKQKMICGVLLLAALYLPASSKECIKTMPCNNVLKAVKWQRPQAAIKKGDVADLPMSPFSRLLFDL